MKRNAFASALIVAGSLAAVDAPAQVDQGPQPQHSATRMLAPWLRPQYEDLKPPPAPSSRWIDAQRKRYDALLAHVETELFVAPVQVRNFGIDRSSRSLIHAQLSDLAGDLALNPYMVQGALGEGRRTIPLYEIQSEASKTHASKLLVVSVGHEGGSSLVATAQTFHRNSAGYWAPDRPMEFSTTLGDDETPAHAFGARILPEIARSLGASLKEGPRPRGPSKFPPAPATPAAAIKASNHGPLFDALMFELFGMLAPSSPERARERLFEQSLLALERTPADDPQTIVLRARAIFYLHSRTAALAALGKADSAAASALRARINGNVPELQEALARIDNPWLRATSELELQTLRSDYGYPKSLEKSTGLRSLFGKSEEWRALLAQRLSDDDPWTVGDNVVLKAILDRTYPVKGISLEETVRGKRALGGDIDPEALGLTVFSHVDRVLGASQSRWNCDIARRYCVGEGLLDLIEAMAISNCVKAVVRAAILQGSMPEADRLISELEGTLEGQPDFSLAVARVLREKLVRQEKSGVAQDQALIRSWEDAANVAAYWEQGQTGTSAIALHEVGITRPMALPYLAMYDRDIPRRADWIDNTLAEKGLRLRNLRAQLEQSSTRLDAAQALMGELPPSERSALAAELADRFEGHPEKVALLALAGGGQQAPAGQTLQSQGTDAKLAQFEEGRKARPDIFDNYWLASNLLVTEKGDYVKAAEIALSYPGFRGGSGYNAVGLSNEAFETGSMFFWRGHLDAARKLYRIAADLDTGSASSIESAARLAILDGDYERAMQGSLEQATRYRSPYAYRDYLSWLFAFNRAKDAWDAFEQVKTADANPQVWIAAHVGLRRDRKSWREIQAWLMSDGIRTAGAERFALIEAVMANAIDRKPDHALPEYMVKLEGEPIATLQAGVLLYPEGDMKMVARPSGLAKPSGQDSSAHPVASHLTKFAKPYVALREGRFDDAVAGFREMSNYYPIEGQGYISNPRFSYALAYFAWASAKSGDKLHLEAFIDQSRATADAKFDMHLAKAFFTGLRGEIEASIGHLQRAFDNQPLTEHRPIFTEYQWAEACEWLYEATRDQRFRDMALRWSRTNQQIRPFQAWAYAMEVQLTKSPSDRRRALGFALYLDAGSERLASIPATEKAAAETWFDAHNPFGRPQPGRTASARARFIPMERKPSPG